jgi:hypothetical protein
MRSYAGEKYRREGIWVVKGGCELQGWIEWLGTSGIQPSIPRLGTDHTQEDSRVEKSKCPTSPSINSRLIHIQALKIKSHVFALKLPRITYSLYCTVLLQSRLTLLSKAPFILSLTLKPQPISFALFQVLVDFLNRTRVLKHQTLPSSQNLILTFSMRECRDTDNAHHFVELESCSSSVQTGGATIEGVKLG